MNNDRPRFGAPAESPLDRAIDRAVRDIMRVDPPAGLRRRVMARIEAPPRRPILFPRLAVAAAALAAIILTVVLMRPAPPAPVSRQAESAAPPPAVPVPVPVAPLVETPASTAIAATTKPAGPTVERIRMPRVGNVFGQGPGVSSTSLRDAPEPAAAGTTDDAPAARDGELAPMTVTPLAVPPIAVTPLRVPSIAPPK